MRTAYPLCARLRAAGRYARRKIAHTRGVDNKKEQQGGGQGVPFAASLQQNLKAVKAVLPAEDILVHAFRAGDGTPCAAVYADGITDKKGIAELAVLPLSRQDAPRTAAALQKALPYPETKLPQDVAAACQSILAGDALLLADGVAGAVTLGAKQAAARAVTEPQTSVTVKGPREGFVEDIKTNLGLIRKRLPTPALRPETLRVGRQSQTAVCVLYLDGIADAKVAEAVKARIRAIDIDGVPDSSYIAKVLAKKPLSLFKQAGTTEKPDILCAKLLEGRVAVLADGSPIALTLPYMLAEDFQSSQDYFVSPYRATVSRLLRLLAVAVSLLLPAFYVAAQLFKLRLLPFPLLMTISGSIQGIPLSPGLELFFLLIVLEVLIEAAVRMPKYVALALSVIGALVLGDTAVKAGLVSSPAIIIVALSGISAYTVPDLAGTLSVIRLAYVVVAGSLGTYGIVLMTALILYYLVTSDAYGVPLLAPFAPLVGKDLGDAAWKESVYALRTRPAALRPKNRTRLRLVYRGGKEE